MSRYKVKGTIPEGELMKSIKKNKDPNKVYKQLSTMRKGATIATVAAVVSGSILGCEVNENTDTSITTSSNDVVATESTVPFQVTGDSAEVSGTPTPKPTKTPSASETTVSPTPAQTGDTTAATGTKTNTPTPTPKPSGNTSGGGSTTKTNTPTPTPKPAAKADPYDDCCDCPDCGRSGSVSYHSARKVHHDAVTHEEKTVTYDKVIRTYKYIANWTDSFKNWCSEHGYSIPEAPSTTGTVVFDYDFQNVLDSSGDKTAKGQVLSEANSIAESMGYEEIPCSYYTEVIDDEYVNLQEITTTVEDQAAWDETIPAGWYCDNCDYYSSSVPKEYDNLDI